jgi:hypothetical protein
VTIDERSMVRAKAKMAEVAKHLKTGGKGEVVLVFQLDEPRTAATISLGKRFDVSPAVRGALSTVPGVVEVAEV